MSRIGLDLSKYIKSNFPVVRKRSALWFFSNEIKNTTAQNSQNEFNTVASNQTNATMLEKTPLSSKFGHDRQVVPRISRNKILLLWRKMDPESKRKYFNMAEFDEIRYKEQKSLWVSEVGSLIMKHTGSLSDITKYAPTGEELQDEFLACLEKYHKSYEGMIQAESTKTLYKDTIRRIENVESSLETKELISAVPKQHRPILSRPRRPPAAFVLYLSDNRLRLKEKIRSQKLKSCFMRLAAEEWAELDPKVKSEYEDKYLKSRDEYLKAMENYRQKIEKDDSGHLIDQAVREKKAFRKSLRKRLRDASILPLSIRNAFNFFLMDNKDVKLIDLTEIWRNLPEDKKMRYIEMSNADTLRYQGELEAYNEIKRGLEELSKRRSVSAKSQAVPLVEKNQSSSELDDVKE